MNIQKLITGVYSENKPIAANLVNVVIDWNNYKFDYRNGLLWDETLNYFSRLKWLTLQEWAQLENQIKFTYNFVI